MENKEKKILNDLLIQSIHIAKRIGAIEVGVELCVKDVIDNITKRKGNIKYFVLYFFNKEKKIVLIYSDFFSSGDKPLFFNPPKEMEEGLLNKLLFVKGI
jgi:hypothetical protein